MSFIGNRAVLIKDLSGNVVSAQSGLNVSIVAGSVNVGTVSVSGNVVSVSGGTFSIVSGTGVRISGETITSINAGASVRINVPVAAIAGSGGSSLGSGIVNYGIKLKHLTSGEGNPISGMVWVGGSGTGLAPFSGNGYPLIMGQELELNGINFNSVRVVAAVSGSLVSAIGVGT